jgi:excisionase family DNA binding protein
MESCRSKRSKKRNYKERKEMNTNENNFGVTKASTELVTRREAAAYLGISEQTLAIWKCTGRYNLAYVKIGRLVKYRRADLDAFIASNLQTA